MCVMKMKKLTTFVACAAMAGVFATSAFAANDAQVARAQDYLNSKGIAYTVTASDVDKAVAAGYTADALVAKANALLGQAKSDPEGAKNEAVNVLNSIGVSVADAKVAVNGNDITISPASMAPTLLIASTMPIPIRKSAKPSRMAPGALLKAPPPLLPA